MSIGKLFFETTKTVVTKAYSFEDETYDDWDVNNTIQEEEKNVSPKVYPHLKRAVDMGEKLGIDRAHALVLLKFFLIDKKRYDKKYLSYQLQIGHDYKMSQENILKDLNQINKSTDNFYLRKFHSDISKLRVQNWINVGMEKDKIESIADYVVLNGFDLQDDSQPYIYDGFKNLDKVTESYPDRLPSLDYENQASGRYIAELKNIFAEFRDPSHRPGSVMKKLFFEKNSSSEGLVERVPKQDRMLIIAALLDRAVVRKPINVKPTNIYKPEEPREDYPEEVVYDEREVFRKYNEYTKVSNKDFREGEEKLKILKGDRHEYSNIYRAAILSLITK